MKFSPDEIFIQLDTGQIFKKYTATCNIHGAKLIVYYVFDYKCFAINGSKIGVIEINQFGFSYYCTCAPFEILMSFSFHLKIKNNGDIHYFCFV